MYGLNKMLSKEFLKLQSIKQIVDERLIDVPKGNLRITSTRNRPQFMYCTSDDTGKRNGQGVYIKQENYILVQKLAQKAYDQKVKRLVDRRLKQIGRLCDEYKDDEIEEIYNKLHPVRKTLIKAVDITWEQQLQKWKDIPYVGKEFDENIPIIYTKKGERVRSKSEKIIADTFYDLGIEYKYECPLNLKGYGVIYPDFTILRRRDGKQIYWEHDGRMDDSQYAEKAIRKINTYVANGIFPGEKLIVTYETSKEVLNDRIIKMMIEKYIGVENNKAVH